MGAQEDAAQDGGSPVRGSPQAQLAEIMAIFEGDRILFEDPVWGELYAARCCDANETLQVAKALSFRDALVAQNLQSQRLKLSLRGLRLGSTAAACLAMQLKAQENLHYTQLDLSSNLLGDTAMLSVRTIMRALPHLRWLTIAGNSVGPDGLCEIAEELVTNENLEIFEVGCHEAATQACPIRTNPIGVEGLSFLFNCLRQNTHSSLTSLSLCDTSLGVDAGSVIANFLREDHGRLLHLDISSNRLTSEGINVLLPQCSHLRLLSIADTGCRGELIHSQLCGLLQQVQCLTHLSLAQNTLESRTLRRIANALANCGSLVSVCLERTSMDAQGVTAVCDALMEAPVHSITDLDLTDNNISKPQVTAVVARVASSAVLQTLRLSNNPLGDLGAYELANVVDPQLYPAASLRCLELSCCRIGTVGAGHILARLKNNCSLRVLRLNDNFVDDKLDTNLVEQMTGVHDLQLSGNRLSHFTMQQISQVCERNRQATRDQLPNQLRAQMHRLLFQEVKRERAREQETLDETELLERQAAIERTSQELRMFRWTEAEAQKHLMGEIRQEEYILSDRRKELVDTVEKLDETIAHFEELHAQLSQTLRDREQELVDVKLGSDQLDDHFRRRKQEHPLQVHELKRRIQKANQEQKKFHASAKNMHRRLQAYREETLVDLKP